MKASNEFERAIQNYLETASTIDPALSIGLAQKEKNISDCCNYIIQEVKNMNVAALADEEVFSLARRYYLAKDAIKPKKISCEVVACCKDGIVPRPVKTLQKEQQRKKQPSSGEVQLSLF